MANNSYLQLYIFDNMKYNILTLTIRGMAGVNTQPTIVHKQKHVNAFKQVCIMMDDMKQTNSLRAFGVLSSLHTS